MLKKFVSAVVGVSCVVASMGAFAAAPTIETATVYDLSGNDKVKVTTTVSDVTSGDVYTYLAYDKDVTTVTDGGQIIYIDQKTVENQETTLEFEFVTAAANVGSNVKVGGKNASGAFDPASGTVPAVPVVTPKLTYTINGGDGGQVEIAETGYTAITIDGVASNVKNATDWFGGINVVYINDAQENVTYNIVVEVVTGDAAGETQGFGMIVAEGAKSIGAIGKATGNVASYGIALSVDNTTFTEYAAKAKNAEGQYTVKFTNIAAGLGDATTVYAKAYWYDGDRVVYGDTFVIDTTSEVSVNAKLVQ